MADSDIRERKYLYFMKNNSEQMSAYNFLEKLGRSHLCMPFITRLIIEFVNEYSKHSIDSISNEDAQQLVKIYLSNIIEPSKVIEKSSTLADGTRDNILDFLAHLAQTSLSQSTLAVPVNPIPAKEEIRRTDGRFQKNSNVLINNKVIKPALHNKNSLLPDDDNFDDELDFNPDPEKIAEMKLGMNAFGLE